MKIRIGDTFSRKWTLYNPLASNRELPDKDAPRNLTGVGIVFVVTQESTIKTFPTDGGSLVITPLTGEIKLELSPTETKLFRVSRKTGTSYLEFTYTDGDVISKYQEDVLFIRKGAQ